VTSASALAIRPRSLRVRCARVRGRVPANVSRVELEPSALHRGPKRSLRTCGEVSDQRAAPLAWVAQLDTLEDVLQRGLSIADVVVQDEYTHDIVTTVGELYVVFDST
jgi:hypothetical protein